MSSIVLKPKNDSFLDLYCLISEIYPDCASILLFILRLVNVEMMNFCDLFCATSSWNDYAYF